MITRYLDRIKKDDRFFLATELSFILFALLLPFVLTIPAHHLEKTAVYVLLYGTFLLMSFICGILVGLQFPLATNIYLNMHSEGTKVGHTAGLLYGADLLGGFFGGLFGGILLFPILGLKGSCFIIGMIKISSGILFFLFTKLKK
jgi:predicted membrane-bound spermidine synthase